MPPTENKAAVVRPGRWKKGESGNPGGRPKALRDIEAMLNAEHRTVANMKEVFATVKALALRGEKGDSGYLKLYLERVLGPVKDIEIDLTDAPPEVLSYLRGLN